MINKLIEVCIFFFMCFCLIFIFPIAMVSVGLEAGKDIYNGKKVKWWGFN